MTSFKRSATAQRHSETIEDSKTRQNHFPSSISPDIVKNVCTTKHARKNSEEIRSRKRVCSRKRLKRDGEEMEALESRGL